MAFSLPMIPIDSPHLQIMPQSFDTQQRHQFLMNISLSRAFMYAMDKNTTSSTTFLESPVLYKLDNYFVTQLSFGSRPHMFSAFFLLDTGSDLTWVQCSGCNPCFEVKGKNIPVQLSRTYKLLSTQDPRCEERGKGQRYCVYERQYGSGEASTMGLVGSDTFMFMDSKEHKQVPFQDVMFGCGLANMNIEFGSNTGPENTISGIFGVSAKAPSILYQLDDAIKGRFSHCLVSWADRTQAEYRKSTMYFGDDAQIHEPNVQKILMNTKQAHAYHLYFRGISVDGKRLRIDPSICALDRRDLNKGFYIDSGSPNTVLPKAIYRPLRAAMVKYFGKFKWTIKKDVYDLCYSAAPKRYPSVVFHFAKDGQGGEVDWVMNPNNMFFNFDNTSVFCMGVVEDPTINACILGAYQQANFLVLYDVRNQILSFAPKRCQEHNALGSST